MNTSKRHADNLKNLPDIRNILICRIIVHNIFIENKVIHGVILFRGYQCENIESHTRNV